MRCITSGRFTPAAATRTRTSVGPGFGSGRFSGTSASGPPGFGIAIAVIVSGRGIVAPGDGRNSYDPAAAMTTPGPIR